MKRNIFMLFMVAAMTSFMFTSCEDSVEIGRAHV